MSFIDNVKHHVAVAGAALAEDRQAAKEKKDKRRARLHELQFAPSAA